MTRVLKHIKRHVYFLGGSLSKLFSPAAATVAPTAPIAATVVTAAAVALILFLSVPVTARALPAKIWESTEESVITRGVTLEKINRFTVDGWLNFDVLRIDLKDNNLSLDMLYNSAAIQDLTTVKDLAAREGAVAAINGGYFEWNAGWGGSATGTVMRDGRIDTAFSGTNAYGDVMGSMTVNKFNEVLFGYYKPVIELRASGTAALYAGSYNKKSFYEYRDISILDRKWTEFSVGASRERPDIVELVAIDGVVSEIRVGMPAITIPVNGFVAVTRADADGGHPFAGAEFAVGSPIAFTVALNPYIADAMMHVEGASMLVRDGVIPSQFSYEPGTLAQRNPRTMAGCTKDGGTLLLVTADGRQATSIGLTSYEAAELMLSLGAYNALNLDGGGSTSMVARTPGTNDLAYINSTSDSTPRAVVNGVGVFTNAPKAAIRGVIIDVLDPNVFVGSRRQFTVRAYDRFYNPVEVAEEDVVWSISGFRGQISNGLLIPATSGEGQVRAKIGRAVATLDVKILSTPSELILNTTSLALKLGETHTFSVIGRDRMGFSARINPADVTWTASDSFGSINGGVFTRNNATYGYIGAAYGNAVAYCAVQPLAPSDNQSGAAEPPPPVKLPQASRINDRANRSAEIIDRRREDVIRFGVLGEPVQTIAAPSAAATAAADNSSASDVNPVRLISEAFAETVNNTLDCGIFVGSAPHPGVVSVKKPAYATNSFFEVHDNFCGDPSMALIRLSSIGGGLRVAGGGQWGNFLAALKTFAGKDLFVILQQGPSTFGDKQEAALLKQTLAGYARDGGYNIWVFYGGATDSVWLEDGVRYFTCAGAASASADPNTGAGAKYLEITIIDGEVTYTYKPLM